MDENHVGKKTLSKKHAKMNWAQSIDIDGKMRLNHSIVSNWKNFDYKKKVVEKIVIKKTSRWIHDCNEWSKM